MAELSYVYNELMPCPSVWCLIAGHIWLVAFGRVKGNKTAGSFLNDILSKQRNLTIQIGPIPQ